NGMISAGYAGNSSGIQFVWTIAPGGNGGYASSAFNAASITGPVSSRTSVPTLSLATWSLSPGPYTISVYATDGTNNSPTNSKEVTLVYGDLSNARIYPNPWRADRGYPAQIIFDQMAAGSTVKVFTVSGRLVKTLDGASGRAVWDLTTDSGDRAASGIYLYLITTGDTGYGGNAAKVHGKLAVIK